MAINRELKMRLAEVDTEVVGINPVPPSHEAYEPARGIAGLVNLAAEILGVTERVEEHDIVNHSDYVGEGYGVPSASGWDAMRLLARTEGIVLDPVYTNKGFSGFVDHIRRGRLHGDGNVVFVHTGGLPALFAYGNEVLDGNRSMDHTIFPSANETSHPSPQKENQNIE